MTVNVGWIGYVQSSRVDTYADSTDTTPNGYVDNADPVIVIMEKNDRYYIQMVKSNGEKALRWVDKNTHIVFLRFFKYNIQGVVLPIQTPKMERRSK